MEYTDVKIMNQNCVGWYQKNGNIIFEFDVVHLTNFEHEHDLAHSKTISDMECNENITF